MNLYSWKIKAYAYLVKVDRYSIEEIEGSNKPIVDENYRDAVALYLATGQLS
ncbi:MAG: CD1375 family protein [Tissierellales bacterium]|jgi:hypothetical protein|nr:CD1375 family protein [Tissierellales bacterium]